jgi:hypothetical protein
MMFRKGFGRKLLGLNTVIPEHLLGEGRKLQSRLLVSQPRSKSSTYQISIYGVTARAHSVLDLINQILAVGAK